MRQVYFAISFLIMIGSSINSEAQSKNDVPFKPSTPANNLNAKSPDKKMFKANVLDIDARVLEDFIDSHRTVSEIKVTRVNTKAARDFVHRYKNVSDAKWFKTEGGYYANFSSNGIDTRIVYKENGTWFYNSLAYTDANLPFELRDMVKSKYYDYDILAVYQYEFRDKTINIIRMQDKQSNMVTLKVCDGEIKDITQHEEN